MSNLYNIVLMSRYLDNWLDVCRAEQHIWESDYCPDVCTAKQLI